MAGLSRKIRQARRCVFCDNGKLTREHIWPQWAAPIFGGHRDPHYYDFATYLDRDTGVRTETKNYWRQGGAHNKRLPVVCGSCNSGWMSEIEVAVRPILEPMALGKARVLSAPDQQTLVEWIVMKLMVAEHNIVPVEVTPRAAREAFKERQAIPPGLQIDLWCCGEDPWRTRWDRYAMNVALEAEEFEQGHNTQDVTFGFGEVLVNALYCPVEGVQFSPDASGDHVLQLWPSTGSALNWPPARIPATGATEVAQAVARALGLLSNDQLHVLPGNWSHPRRLVERRGR